MKSTNTQRFALIDTIRGFLVIAMVIYHAVYCFVSFSIIKIDLYTGFWWWFPRSIAAGFLTVSGWSLAASRSRGKTFKQASRRLVKLAGLALVVSLATLITFGPQYFVFFGILHCIAAASLICWPIAAPIKKEQATFVASSLLFLFGSGLLATGIWLGTKRFDFPWLAWLGFRPAALYPVDYEPLFPWMAWFVFGIALYPISLVLMLRNKRITAHASTVHDKPTMFPEPYHLTLSASANYKNDDAPAPAQQTTHKSLQLLSIMSFLGKHSLIIYLVHLPVLYGLAWIIALAF